MAEEKQATSSVLMVRPANFSFNEQTAGSNAFQRRPESSSKLVHEQALREFDDFVGILRSEGVDVIVIEDTQDPSTPDSIFPNNWISTHANGSIYLYPMQAENRRLERRSDIIETLKNSFQINAIQDLSAFEQNEKFLEGTGSMILDRSNKIVYACLSPRTDRDVLQEFCKLNGYVPILFNAFDIGGTAIYHTNVLMCVASKFAVICLDAIRHEDERKLVVESLMKTGKEIIQISFEQMSRFAGNMLELVDSSGESLLVMSARAEKALSKYQKVQIAKFSRIVSADLETIENNGGGSARCMLAEIHLSSK